jgi:hypothetical protein
MTHRTDVVRHRKTRSDLHSPINPTKGIAENPKKSRHYNLEYKTFMAHGKELSQEEAQKNIRKFVDDEIKRTGQPEKDIAVGHLLDLSLVEKLMADIRTLIAKGVPINGIRVYYAKSKLSMVSPEEYDVVVVPVLSSGNDYYNVYNRPVATATATGALGGGGTGVIGGATPCPNVCNG